jgi:hypothetical protein
LVEMTCKDGAGKISGGKAPTDVVPSGSSGFFAALRMTATTCDEMQQQKHGQAAWFSLPSPEGRVSLCVLDCKPGGLMLLRRTVFRLFVLGLFSFGYAAVPQSPQPPQNPQARPAPGGGRPQPSRPNPGGPQIQPVRPGPGGGNNRPQPGRPNPGVRPPPRPTPRPPVRPGRPPQWAVRRRRALRMDGVRTIARGCTATMLGILLTSTLRGGRGLRSAGSFRLLSFRTSVRYQLLCTRICRRHRPGMRWGITTDMWWCTTR